MKSINFFKYRILMLAAVAMIGFTACSDDDDDPTPPILVEDGMYIKGGGTALTEFDVKGTMKPAFNEADENNDRTGLYEIYVAVKAGSEGFNIVEIAGADQITWGPGSDFAAVVETDLHQDEPRLGFWRGSIAHTETPFTVPEDGLYHIAIDETLQTVVMAKVRWGLIGGATPGGWGSNTDMSADFDLESMTFVVEEVPMAVDEFKFRYSNGWKMFLDAPDNTVSVNTNFGTAINNLVPGGPNIANSERAEFKFTLTWTLGEDYVATQEKTGELDPAPEFPEAMFLVGAASAYDWDTPGDNEEAQMHKIAGGGDNVGIYWKIAHLEGGAGWKLSAANWSSPNIGFGEVDEFDADGVVVTDTEGNMAVAESGMYMIVLDLRGEMIKISVEEVAVYGIGDAFGGWDDGVEANLFTVDNAAKTVTSPALTADGNIRMYAAHSWIPAWWNAEFNVFDGKIIYRADGGDQDAVPGTAGQVITLNFDDNTGSID